LSYSGLGIADWRFAIVE